jgi:hypothetical protein
VDWGESEKFISAIAALALVAVGSYAYYEYFLESFESSDFKYSLESYVISTGAVWLIIAGVWWFWWVTKDKFAPFWREIFSPFSTDERLQAFLKGSLDVLQSMLALAVTLAAAKLAKSELLYAIFGGGLAALTFYVTSFVFPPICAW